jgi:hypothetical protein
VSGVCKESVLPIAWSKVAPKYSGGEKEAVNSEMLHSRRPIPVSNRYSVFTYLPESTIEDEMASLGSGRITQLYANNYKKNNESGGLRNSQIKHHPVQRLHFSSLHVPGSAHGSNYKNDSHSNYILTLVNGQVCVSKKDGTSQCE